MWRFFACLAAVGLLAAGVHFALADLGQQLGILVLALAGLVLVALITLILKARDAFEEYGAWLLIQMVVWHHIGRPYHGDPITNATWHYRGTRALTETGHARRCYYWPRRQLVAVRCTRSAVVLAALYGLAAYTLITCWLLVLAGLGLGYLGARRGWAWFREANHNREVLTPLHLATHHLVDLPIGYKPQGWIEVSQERDQATLHLPVDYNPETVKDSKLVDAVTAKLGLEDPLVKWKLAGTEPTLKVSESPHPPRDVSLQDIMPSIASTPWSTFVPGLGRPHAGRRSVVTVELGESPHTAVSIGSGGGKTVLERLRAAQWAYKGGIVFILNPKRQGYQWAKGLKNVVVAETPEQIFYLLVYLGEQFDKRNETASEHADIDDVVPEEYRHVPWLIIVEEMNLLIGRQVKFWRKNKEWAAAAVGLDPEEGPLPKDSPALDSLDELAFGGRQSDIYIDFVGQRLSSKVISGDVLENCNARILGRWSDRVKTMLAPEYTLPAKSNWRGRIAVIVGGKVRECQVANASPQECRDLAMQGEACYPDSVPDACVTKAPESVAGEDSITASSDSHGKRTIASSIGASSGLVTLSRAVASGLCKDKTLTAVRNDRVRYRAVFPKPVERHWNVDYFNADEIIAFYEVGGVLDRVSSGRVGSPV